MRNFILLYFLGVAAVSLHAQSSVPTVARLVPPQILAPAGASLSLNLADYFTLPGVTGSVVQFDTVMGKFNVELRADAAPQEVANFLNYVQAGRYSNSFFHRSASLDPSGAVSIVQGGGFFATSPVSAIGANAPVPLEYKLPNERGTLAAARGADPNSATSQWYFNVRDNTSILDSTNGGGYTVFGRVLGTGISVVDAIAALPRVNASGGDPSSPFQELPVRNYSGGNVDISTNLVIVNSIIPMTIFPGTGSPSVFNFLVQSSNSGVVTASLSGSTLTLTPGAAGTAMITVQATDVGGSTVATSFSATVASTLPGFSTQPASQTVAVGNSVVFSASVTAADTYQWQRNGADLSGATNSMLVLSNVSTASAGAYTLMARNPNGAVVSNAAALTVANPAPVDAGRLVNLSIRSAAGVGDQTLIVGFALGGAGTSGSMPLFLRGMGPSLTQFGLTNVLADPVITLYSGANSIATNNDWNGDPQIEARRAQVGAFAFTSNLDAALAVAPSAASYTMQVTGNGGATSGTALAEIYDATPALGYTTTTPRLVNLSARTQVGTGDNVLIASFVISGTTAKTVLIRAAGPALQRFGVSGYLTDPKLQVTAIASGSVVAENDNWGGDPQVIAAANSVGAYPFYNGASGDAALLLTLAPGSYSAKVVGADGGTGVSLVEVYEVQ